MIKQHLSIVTIRVCLSFSSNLSMCQRRLSHCYPGSKK